MSLDDYQNIKKYLIELKDIELLEQLPTFLIDLIAQYSHNLEKIFQDLIDWVVRGGAQVRGKITSNSGSL